MTNATLLKRALCASTAAWDYKTTREIAKCSLPTIRRTLLALEAEGSVEFSRAPVWYRHEQLIQNR
jgi:hypothetical protein